jgi:hypothetical protein
VAAVSSLPGGGDDDCDCLSGLLAEATEGTSNEVAPTLQLSINEGDISLSLT